MILFLVLVINGAVFKQELVDLFNAGLKNIRENGKYDEIIAKYLG